MRYNQPTPGASVARERAVLLMSSFGGIESARRIQAPQPNVGRGQVEVAEKVGDHRLLEIRGDRKERVGLGRSPSQSRAHMNPVRRHRLEAWLDSFIATVREVPDDPLDQDLLLWGRARRHWPVEAPAWMITSYCEVIASRIGAPVDDPRTEVMATAIGNVMWLAFVRWLQAEGARPLSVFVEESFTVLSQLNYDASRPAPLARETPEIVRRGRTGRSRSCRQAVTARTMRAATHQRHPGGHPWPTPQVRPRLTSTVQDRPLRGTGRRYRFRTVRSLRFPV
jgi:hypothetical protein